MNLQMNDENDYTTCQIYELILKKIVKIIFYNLHLFPHVFYFVPINSVTSSIFKKRETEK